MTVSKGYTVTASEAKLISAIIVLVQTTNAATVLAQERVDAQLRVLFPTIAVYRNYQRYRAISKAFSADSHAYDCFLAWCKKRYKGLVKADGTISKPGANKGKGMNAARWCKAWVQVCERMSERLGKLPRKDLSNAVFESVTAAIKAVIATQDAVEAFAADDKAAKEAQQATA